MWQLAMNVFATDVSHKSDVKGIRKSTKFATTCTLHYIYIGGNVTGEGWRFATLETAKCRVYFWLGFNRQQKFSAFSAGSPVLVRPAIPRLWTIQVNFGPSYRFVTQKYILYMIVVLMILIHPTKKVYIVIQLRCYTLSFFLFFILFFKESHNPGIRCWKNSYVTPALKKQQGKDRGA